MVCPVAVSANRLTGALLASASRSTQPFARVGFNTNHSLGAMLFAAIYLSLAIQYMGLLRASPTLIWLAVVGVAGYLLLAQRYWFRTPLIGIAISGAWFLGAALTG